MIELISRNTSVLPVTLEAAKEHASVTNTIDDALIVSYIKSACRQVEHYCQRTIFPASYRLTLQEWPILDKEYRRHIWLQFPAIDQITLFKYVNSAGADVSMVRNTDYYASLYGSRPFLKAVSAWPESSLNRYVADPIVIEYTTKAPDVLDENLQLAIMMLTASFYNNRETFVETRNLLEMPGAAAFTALLGDFKRYIL